MNRLNKRLLHDFYQLAEIETTADGACQALLLLNPEHPIFDGHFPGLPVVPGVCMLQMTKETLEHVLGRETRLQSARNMKFLSVLNPCENKTVRLELWYHPADEGQISLESTLLDPDSGKTFFKMKGIFA